MTPFTLGQLKHHAIDFREVAVWLQHLLKLSLEDLAEQYAGVMALGTVGTDKYV